jgi:hypothetical protein
MAALLIFHLKAGVRVAVRSFAILFSTILGWIMLDMNPAAIIVNLATTMYSDRSSLSDLAPVAVLAFVFPLLAARKLVHGLNGWIRHLAFSSATNRRGMAVALAAAQLPLALALVFFALVAKHEGLSIGLPAIRLLLILASGAMAALPVTRRILTTSAALLSTMLAIQGGWGSMLTAFGLLIGAEAAAGPLRTTKQRQPWRTADSLLNARIAWRASALARI